METDCTRNVNGVTAQPSIYDTLNFDYIKDGNARIEETTYSGLNRKKKTRCIIILLTIIIVVVSLIAVALGVALGVVLNREAQVLARLSAYTQDGGCSAVSNSACSGTSSKTCTCKPGYKPSSYQLSCTLVLTYVCTEDSDCSAVANSVCSGSASKTCACKPGYKTSSDQLSCTKVLTNVCTEDSDCSAVENSVCSGSASKTCACKPGYKASSDQLSCTAVLTSACTQDGDCSAVSNSVCSGTSSKTCTCKPGYKPTPDQLSCTLVLTNACTEDSDCRTVSNAVCSGSSSKTCACKPGYKTSSDQLSCTAEPCSGWVQFANSCYNFLNDIPRTFLEAVGKCSQYNSHVLYIESADENNFLKQQLQNSSVQYWWNGMTDEREEGTWRWYGTNEVVTFFNWNVGEPNNLSTTDDCCHMGKSFSYKWNDTPCRPPLGYEAYAICEKTVTDLST